MANISKLKIEDTTYDIKDTTARSDISTLNSNVTILDDKVSQLEIQASSLLKDKKTIIIGDSLCLEGRWGDKFVYFSGCDGEVYGNGSAGFTSEGITEPYVGMTFGEMLEDIASDMTTAEKNAIDYLIVGGGINDALNNHSPSDIKTAVNNFISDAKDNFPNAKIIIFPIHTFAWLTGVQVSRYQAILERCTDSGIMTTGDFLFWTVDDRTYDSGDHTHLTDTGYQVIANKILSWINGTTNALIENVDYTLETGWELGTWLNIFKRDNIVYVQGILHYTNGTISAPTAILTFTKGEYITGGTNYNKYLFAVYYSSGSEALSTVNVLNGQLKTGRPLTYTALSQPYVYFNGSFPVGLQ